MVATYAGSPASKGWGLPGDTREEAAAFYRKNIVKVTSPDGVQFTCHRLVAPIYTAFLKALHAQGYRLDRKRDDWGYANRDMRTGPKKSYHAWGLALDLNATTNPVSHDGRNHTDLPRNISALAKKFGLEWGGDWNSVKDPMHFQFTGSVSDAVALVKRLSMTVPTTPNKPEPKPEPPKPQPVPVPPKPPVVVKPKPKPQKPVNDLDYTGRGVVFSLAYKASGVTLRNLRYGRDNHDVAELQRMLGLPVKYQTGHYGEITRTLMLKIQQKLGMPKQFRSGNYDPMTAWYVQKFQLKRGSRGKYADGILGPQQTKDLLS